MPTLTASDWQEPQLPRTQEALLRAFDPYIPWYSRPPSARPNAPQVEDFSRWVHARMIEELSMRTDPEMRGQDLSFSRLATRHICYSILRCAAENIVQQRGPAEIVSTLRFNLRSIIEAKILPVRHWHHPLSSQTHRLQQMPSGPAIKATVPDVKLAEWLRGGANLERLIEGMPELVRLSPDARLIIYAKRLREQLKTLLDSNMPTEEVRENVVRLVTDEWVTMIPADYQERVMEIAREIGLPNIFDVSEREVVSRLNLERRVNSAEDEERMNPLLQQLALRLALEREPSLSELSEQWSKLLTQYKVAACDRPFMTVAMLAAMLGDRSLELKDIREKL